jgi:2-hydroxychromene-2-carboxylate isomerase
MNRHIDFYFDFSSPYGYFASTRIEALAAKYGRTVKWHPLLLGVVFKTTGGIPLTQAPMKGKYAFHDFDRTARFHGIPYQRPDTFPLPTQFAARAMLWIRQAHGDDLAVEFAKAVYRAYFFEGLNISVTESVASVVAAVGLDAAAVTEAANSEPVKERMKKEMDTAMGLGVFGSPFTIVDGEPFWGFDRFYQIEEYLKNGKI